MQVAIEDDDTLEPRADEPVDHGARAAARAEQDGLARHLLAADELVERRRKPGHVGVVPDEPLPFARERVDGAGDLRLLRQLVDQRDDPLLVRDRDVHAEEVVAADLCDGVREGDRGPVPQLIPGIDAQLVEGSLLHRPGQRVRHGVADEDDPLAHDRILSRSAKKPGYEIADAGSVGDGGATVGDEAGDREREREPVVSEAVDEPASQRGRAIDVEIVADGLDPGTERAQAVHDSGDPVRFLVAQLARAADRRSGRAPALPRGTGSRISSIAAGGVRGSQLDRARATTTGRRRSASGLADALERARATGVARASTDRLDLDRCLLDRGTHPAAGGR